jgi:hypothetical protein
MSTKTYRFKLENEEIGIIGYYETRTEALRVAIPGDSLFDRMAGRGDIELWIVSGDLDHKIDRPIRRKHD